MRRAKTGDTVKARFTGIFDGGTEFASSQGKGPVEFTIGGGRQIQGFEEGAIGMAEGDKKSIRPEPGGAFGGKRPNLSRRSPEAESRRKSIFPQKLRSR